MREMDSWMLLEESKSRMFGVEIRIADFRQEAPASTLASGSRTCMGDSGGAKTTLG
jgi:hypothetical protein